MSALSEFYLASRSDVRQYELIEISHPDFTQTYRVIRNQEDGNAVTVDLSPSELAVEFQYYPCRIELTGSRDDLDFGVKVTLGDVGEIIPDELDAVTEAGGILTKPTMRYWTYRSDNLEEPIFGPAVLEIPQFATDEQGSSFEARAPRLNSNKTGERQTMTRFPPQRGLV